MLGYKLFRLMSVLGKSELPEIEKFLESPFHNTSKECTQLFRQLCKFHPSMDSPRLTKEFLYARVYGKTGFDDGKMRKLMTRLTALLERFLTLKELEDSAEMSSRLLIRSLEKRSDYRLFKAAVESRINELESRPGRGMEYFRETYQLFQSLLFHAETNKFTVEHEYFQHYLMSFESYFILVTLQNGTENIISQRLTRSNAEIHFLKAADRIAAETTMADIPVVNFFHRIFRVYSMPGAEVDIEGLRESLFGCFDQMGFHEQRMALKLLINYAIPYTNQGSVIHTKLIFDLYKIGVEKGMLILGESAVNTDLFLNITTAGLLVGEFDWTQDFIKKHGELLPDHEREIALDFCMANWYYYKGIHLNSMEEFERALQSINLIPIRASEKFDLRARSLQLRVKYEVFRRNAETLDNILATAKNFRRHIAANQTYSETKKDTYFKFIHHYNVLSRLANAPDLEALSVEKALLDLTADENCIMRRWLDEKLRELLNI